MQITYTFRSFTFIFPKLSDIGFFSECFTADFSQFCSTTVKTCHLGARLSTFPSIPSISGISMKVPDFLRTQS